MEGVAMGGETDKLKGTIKEGVGKATDDKRTESEGKLDQAKGNAKEAFDDAKDALKRN
jgi:uncharacterized protein YjbJ (UPF0337 family)